MHVSNIPLGVDETDHFAFWCPHCDASGITTAMHATNVVTKKVQRDKCTWIYLQCPVCGSTGQRKTYWTEADEGYCGSRTDSLDKFHESQTAKADQVALSPDFNSHNEY